MLLNFSADGNATAKHAFKREKVENKAVLRRSELVLSLRFLHPPSSASLCLSLAQEAGSLPHAVLSPIRFTTASLYSEHLTEPLPFPVFPGLRRRPQLHWLSALLPTHPAPLSPLLLCSGFSGRL